MNSRVCAIIVAALIGGASAIAAPDPTPAPPPPNSSDTAGVWETVPDAMRHVQSGMKCPLYVEGLQTKVDETHSQNHYIRLESVALISSNRPRGDDVACNYHDTEGREAVVTATRLRDGETSSDLFVAAKADIMKNLPGAKDVYNRSEMMIDFFRYQGQGHRHADIASFRIEGNGTVSILAIIMDTAGGWAVQVEMLDLTTDYTHVVERAATYSWMLTDQIKAAQK